MRKKRSIPVSDGHASRANIAREGAVGSGLVKHLKKSEGDVFFARDGKGLQKDHWGIRIRRKYTCAEETMPVYCKPSRSDVAFGTCEQVHRRHVIAQWDIEVLVFGRPWRMGEPFLAYSGASLWATSSRGFSIRSPIWGRRSDPDVTGMS